MKKLTALLIILMLALPLAACSRGPETTTVGDQTPGTPAEVSNPSQPKDASAITLYSEQISLSALTKPGGFISLTVTSETLEPIYESDEEITFYWDLWAWNGSREELIRASAAAHSHQLDTSDGKWRIDMLEVIDEDENTHGSPIAVTGTDSVSLIWNRTLTEEKINQITRFNVRLAVAIGDEVFESEIITFGRDVIENVLK